MCISYGHLQGIRNWGLVYPNLALDLLFENFCEPYQISMIIVDSSLLEHILVVATLIKVNDEERMNCFTNIRSLTVFILVLIARNESS